MLRRFLIVLFVALFAVGDMSASIVFAQDTTQQQPVKKRRTLFDMLFGTFRNPKEWKGEAGFFDGSSRKIGPLLIGREIA